MSDIAVSLLGRIILPRPGEPLDVRKLYIEESSTNARRAHAATRTHLADRRGVGGVVLDVLQRVPGELLAALVDALRRWCCTSELTGTGRVDVYRSKATGARIFVEGRPFHHDADEPHGARVRDQPRALRGRRLDLVRHHHRHPGHAAERRLVRTGARTGHGEHRGGYARRSTGPTTASTPCAR